MTKGRAEQFFRKAMGPLVAEGGPFFLRNLLDLTHFGVAEPGCDYQLSLGSILIECKNTDRSGALTDKISDRQRKQLEDHGGFVFLGMWDAEYPRLPDGADFYLLSWEAYKNYVEQFLAIPYKSFRRHGASRAIGADDVIPEEYKLDYKTGVGPVIPKDHIFWHTCHLVSVASTRTLVQVKEGSWMSLYPGEVNNEGSK